jgi:hypothetical protein
MVGDHEFTIETRETSQRPAFVARCSCGWESKREFRFDLASLRGTAHTLRSQMTYESTDPPREADSDAGEAGEVSEPIGLSDAVHVISLLQGVRVHAFLKVGDHASTLMSGPLHGGRTPSAGGIEIRVQTRSISASFDVSDERFISAAIAGSVMKIEFTQSWITLIATEMQGAWRHVRISKRWLAEQPPNDDTAPTSDSRNLR